MSLSWSEISLEGAEYEIRQGADWNTSPIVATGIKGGYYQLSATEEGSLTYLIKAYNGFVLSANASSDTLDVASVESSLKYATVVIAANDSLNKNYAEYVVPDNSVNAETIINTAIQSCTSTLKTQNITIIGTDYIYLTSTTLTGLDISKITEFFIKFNTGSMAGTILPIISYNSTSKRIYVESVGTAIVGDNFSILDFRGIILLMDGLYTISAKIQLLPNITLKGIGKATEIKHKSSITPIDSIFEILYLKKLVQNITIEDLKINGNSLAESALVENSWNPPDYVGCSGFTIDNVYFSNFTNYAINFGQLDVDAIGNYFLNTFCIVKNCSFENSFGGINLYRSANIIKVLDNVFTNCYGASYPTGYPICIVNQEITSTEYPLVSGNISRNGSGMLIDALNSLIINNRNEVSPSAFYYSTGIVSTGSGSSITNNVCTKMRTGISVTGEKSIINQNKIEYNLATGLQIASSNNVVVNNYIINNSTETNGLNPNLLVKSTGLAVNYNNIQNNILRSPASGNKPSYAIHVSSSDFAIVPDKTIVSNNDMKGADAYGTASYLDEGTNTVATGNRI